MRRRPALRVAQRLHPYVYQSWAVLLQHRPRASGRWPTQNLARTGDLGREAFVITAGRVEVRRDGKVVAVLGRGDVAGELAVTTATRRNADLVAVTDVELVVFDARSFRSAMALSESLHDQVATAQQTRTVA